MLTKLLNPTQYQSRSLCMLLIACTTLLLSACSTTTIKTTDLVPIVQQNEEIAEELLLDVGVSIFNPGDEEALQSVDEENMVFVEVRNAEARYLPQLIVNTLQTSAGWGAVRVVPNPDTAVDVILKGKILHSDGESMTINMDVSDATGRQWFNREYQAVASRYSYDERRKSEFDAFQSIYNEISNDMLAYKNNLADKQILDIRTIAELKFAQSFAPQTFSRHLGKNKQGQLVVNQLPADNDPMIVRIRQIRERDYLFIDTMQEYYTTFAKSMERPYWRWRQESYHEVMALRQLQDSSDKRMAVGVATLVAGILSAAKSSNAIVRTSGTATMAAGGYVIKSSIDQESESKIHIEALQELGDSLEASIEPQVIELEDRTITLEGTVDNQYQQWRKILQEIYKIDTGGQINQ
jgi:hypothetical protein